MAKHILSFSKDEPNPQDALRHFSTLESCLRQFNLLPVLGWLLPKQPVGGHPPLPLRLNLDKVCVANHWSGGSGGGMVDPRLLVCPTSPLV